MKKVNIALCEDNEYFRESLRQFIDDTPGFNVTCCLSSAANIIESIQECVPNLILMDIDMPGMSGIEATALVKTHFPEVQIMILTVYEDDEKIFKAIMAGASGYLLKKTTPAKILESINEVLEGGASMSASIVKKVLNYFNQNSQTTNTNAYTLSERELDILKCLVNGDSYKMIADNCDISIGTVRSHISAIYRKLHINSKSEAVAKAIKEKLVS